jgi:hypothetical protein
MHDLHTHADKNKKGHKKNILPMAHLLPDIFYISIKAASMVIFLWSIFVPAYSLFSLMLCSPPLLNRLIIPPTVYYYISVQLSSRLL